MSLLLLLAVAPLATAACDTRFDYAAAFDASLLFYELCRALPQAMRSGPLDATNRVPWRGNSAMGDVGEHGEDLTGGLYDAGDTVKLGLPFASSASLLAWGFLENGDELSITQQGDFRRVLRWFTDYMVKAHVAPNVLYVQVGDVTSDHNFWGRAEDLNIPRPAYKVDATHPGSDVAGETAAALAAASMVFRDVDAGYATTLLAHAQQLFTFANTYRGRYNVEGRVPIAGSYPSAGYNDELAWAAMWLYKATGTASYLATARTLYTTYLSFTPWSLDWDEKTVAVAALLADETREAVYVTAVRQYLAEWLPGGSVRYSPLGLAVRAKWGSLRYAMNSALVGIVYVQSIAAAPPSDDDGTGGGTYDDDGTGGGDDDAAATVADAASGAGVALPGAAGTPTADVSSAPPAVPALTAVTADAVEAFVMAQLHYALGSTGRSYVVGVGVNPPVQPHHAGASCRSKPAPCDWADFSKPDPNPQVLTGALVGGPDDKDVYTDLRSDYVGNEVALDYNAGFTAVLAWASRRCTSSSSSASATPSPSLTSTRTSTRSPTASRTASKSSTPSRTASKSSTPSRTASKSSTPSRTSSKSLTSTKSTSWSATASRSATSSRSDTASTSVSSSTSMSATASRSESSSVSLSRTASPSRTPSKTPKRSKTSARSVTPSPSPLLR